MYEEQNIRATGLTLKKLLNTVKLKKLRLDQTIFPILIIKYHIKHQVGDESGHIYSHAALFIIQNMSIAYL